MTKEKMKGMQNIRSSKRTAVGKTKWCRVIPAAVLACAMFTGCVKDPVYNTPHPDHGRITLTTGWDDRGGGIEIPGNYTVRIGDYTATLSGATNVLDHLFTPDKYGIYAYNTADAVTVSGTVATVAAASGNWDGVGSFVTGTPGWLFTHVQQVEIEKDREYGLKAPMRQQVRQLTLVVEPAGGAAARIAGIEGYLAGAAGTLDFERNEYGTPSNVELSFTRIATGSDAGKWSVTVRLLGIAGGRQRLTATIRFADDNPRPVTLDSDLTTALDGFNDDKKTPLTLGATIAETPDEAGFTATITGWTEVDNGQIEIK